MRVEQFINELKQIFPASIDGTNKSQAFANLIRELFGGDLFSNGDHFLVLIGDIYYDLSGAHVEGDTVKYFIGEGLKSAKVWDFQPVEIEEESISSTHDYEFTYDTGL